jgi:hypothetical protein
MKVWFKNRIRIQIEWKENALRSFPIRWQVKARARSARVVGLPHGSATIGKEWLGWRGMKVGKIFFEEGCSSELTKGLESGFLEYLISDMDAGQDDDQNLESSEIFSNTSMVPRNCTSWRQRSRRLSSWWQLEGWLGSRWWLELGWLEDHD